VKAYLNGDFLPLEEARVPVLDRGFIYGDGIYELIPSFSGLPFRLEQHLDRLSRNLQAVRIPDPYPRERWRRLVTELVEPRGDSAVYLQVTRGVAPRDHAFPANAVPTVFAMCNSLPPVSPQVLKQGITVTVIDDYRWGRCDIKAIALLANIMMRQQALDAGAQEAILIRNGLVTEAAAANVFAVVDELIWTPPEGPAILPGITRALVLELAAGHCLPVRVAPLPQAVFEGAEEIWLTSSSKDVLPVTRLGNRSVGSGKSGPVWHKMHLLFQQYKAAQLAGAGSVAAA
jgi:D-alanine transaminase